MTTKTKTTTVRANDGVHYIRRFAGLRTSCRAAQPNSKFTKNGNELQTESEERASHNRCDEDDDAKRLITATIEIVIIIILYAVGMGAGCAGGLIFGKWMGSCVSRFGCL